MNHIMITFIICVLQLKQDTPVRDKSFLHRNLEIAVPDTWFKCVGDRITDFFVVCKRFVKKMTQRKNVRRL